MGGSLFAGLDTALSGLEAQQAVIAVTAHNIANANTPGYSRQQAVLAANPPYAPPALHDGVRAGQFGQGVTVKTVRRLNSRFLSLQQWSNDAAVGASTQQTQTLDQVQAMFNEPSANGLNNALDAFWNAWQNLGNDPQSTAARTQVIAAGQSLATQFQTLDGQLSAAQSSLDASVGQQVGVVNQLEGQIAQLNSQIAAVSATGQRPNDLEDARGRLIGQLAGLLPITVTWQADGAVTVSSGNVDLVAGTQTTPLVATPDPANSNYLALTWGSNGIAATPTTGTLGALLTLRDQTVAGYRSQLNTLATGVATQVNTAHQAGYDLTGTAGQAFFGPLGGSINAGNIAVNPAIVGNPALVAASSSAGGVPGGGSNAVAIADLQDKAFLSGGAATPSDFYASLVGQLGADASAASSRQSDVQTLQQGITKQQQVISGVSLDQEMTTMVEAQNAYASAARVTSTIDQMLNTLQSM